MEQKNWAIVRTIAGYHRYDTQQELLLLNKIWILQSKPTNYFHPQQKLIGKVRDGAKLTKKYDKATTPHQRADRHEKVAEATKKALARTYAQTNPAAVQREIQDLTGRLLALVVAKTPQRPNPRPHVGDQARIHGRINDSGYARILTRGNRGCGSVKKHRVAVIGYGVAGTLHARLLAGRPDTTLVAIIDTSVERREHAARQHPKATVSYYFDEIDTLVDTVVLATPPVNRDHIIHDALTQHHSNVLCEKPAVLDPETGDGLKNTAKRLRLALEPVHNYLYSPTIRRMRHLIADKVIGHGTLTDVKANIHSFRSPI